MRNIRFKDLISIFLILSLYIILTYYHETFLNKAYLEFTSLILLVIFSGYSFVSLLRPNKNYNEILRKPALLLGYSGILLVITGAIAKFSPFGLHLRSLTLFLSLLTMLMVLCAYLRKINFSNSLTDQKVKKITQEKIESNSNPLFNLDVVAKYDLIIILLLSFFTISTFLVRLSGVTLGVKLVHDLLGIIFIGFVPGYLACIIVIPRENLKNRLIVLFSIGLSLTISSLVGLALHDTQYGISTNSILVSVAILSIILTIIAIIRRRKM